MDGVLGSQLSNFTFPSLKFLICKMGIKKYHSFLAHGVVQVNCVCMCFSQCQTHSSLNKHQLLLCVSSPLTLLSGKSFPILNVPSFPVSPLLISLGHFSGQLLYRPQECRLNHLHLAGFLSPSLRFLGHRALYCLEAWQQDWRVGGAPLTWKLPYRGCCVC